MNRYDFTGSIKGLRKGSKWRLNRLGTEFNLIRASYERELPEKIEIDQRLPKDQFVYKSPGYFEKNNISGYDIRQFYEEML